MGRFRVGVDQELVARVGLLPRHEQETFDGVCSAISEDGFEVVGAAFANQVDYLVIDHWEAAESTVGQWAVGHIVGVARVRFEARENDAVLISGA